MATGGHTSGDAVTGVTVSFTIVAVICTILRLYTRFALNKMGGVDDVFIAIATVCSPRQHLRSTLTQCIDFISGTHNYNVRSRYVSLKLNDSWRARTLIHGSQIWHGTTLIVTHFTRSLVDQQMVLVVPMDLLPRTLLC
jgi:Flp pilus assembly protein protease CpaA